MQSFFQKAVSNSRSKKKVRAVIRPSLLGLTNHVAEGSESIRFEPFAFQGLAVKRVT